jgi:hypothetical protein
MANTLNLGTDGNWAVKKDSLLGYNSENNNYKPLPFDFTRASSATVVNKAGLIETVGSGEPRIDFKDDAKGALLLEPSRTNLLQYSEDFTSTEWTKNSVSTPIADSISPDGSLNGYSVTNNATGTCILYDNEIGASLLDSTFSVFFKYKDLQYVSLRIDSPTDTALFDILNGSIVGSDATITPRIKNYGNGWYRCSITHDSLTAAGNAVIMWNESGVLNDNTMASTNVGYYIYGAQFEVGSYATSYIPTSGSAVTRVGESSSQTVPDGVIGQTEGVMLLDVGKYESIGSISSAIIFISNALGDKLGFAVSNTKLIRVRVNAVNEEIGGTQVENSKTAIRYTSIGIDVFYNGVKQTLTTIGSEVFSLPTSVSVVVPNQTYGIKGLQLYNTALTDQELIALTTI